MKVWRAVASDRPLLSVSLYTSSLCDTFSHVFTTKSFSRSRVLKNSIIISHGSGAWLREHGSVSTVARALNGHDW